MDSKLCGFYTLSHVVAGLAHNSKIITVTLNEDQSIMRALAIFWREYLQLSPYDPKK
jgi:hypothetical protein